MLVKRLKNSKRLFLSLVKNSTSLNAFLNDSPDNQISKVFSELKFPYKFDGFPFVPDTKSSFMFKQICGNSNLSEMWICDHLKKIFYGVIYSLANKDEVFLKEYCQENLFNQLSASLELLQNKGFKVI